ncbi:MAG: aldo/keto reductase [Fimbriimonas sp.]
MSEIPFHRLANGDQMPALGLGTFGSDRYSAQEVGAAVVEAISAGYRHIDCAAVYRNEPEVGAAIHASGVAREQLWITSKVWNDRHEDAVSACEDSLRDLGLDYLDLYLIHWPYPHHHAPGVDVGSRDPHARPFDCDAYLRTWRHLESLVERGLVRHIGTSNMTVRKFEAFLPQANIRPAANEMELHPNFQQPELFEYVQSQGMIPIGYSPFGSPSRPERDRTPEDTFDLTDPVILEIAEAHNLTPAQVCIKWAIQRGQVPIPFSVKPSQFLASLEAASSSPLPEEDLARIARIDRRCRLIKGQVFLWEGATSWEDLWDEA